MTQELYYKVYPTAEKGKHKTVVSMLKSLTDRLKEDGVLEFNGNLSHVELTEAAIQDQIMNAYRTYSKGERFWKQWGGADFLVDSLAKELQTYLTALAEHPTDHSILLHNIDVNDGFEGRADSELSELDYSRAGVDPSYKDRLQSMRISSEDFLRTNLEYAELKRILAPQETT